METAKFLDITGSEASAMTYLTGVCLKAGAPRCPGCGCARLYDIEKSARKRCALCGRSFRIFTGRWIGRNRLKAVDWLRILRLFEMDETSASIAARTGVSYPAVLRAVTTVRLAILSEDENGAARETPAGCGKKAQMPGFVERPAAGGARLPIPRKYILYRTTVGGHEMVFADRTLDCGSILAGGEELGMIDDGGGFPGCRVYCAGEGFWIYARERLKRYRGFSLGNLPLYLKGEELRWENGDSRLFDLLVERVCGYADRQDAIDMARRPPFG